MEKFVKKYAIINSSKAKVKVSIKVAIKENLHEGKNYFKHTSNSR